MVNKKKKTSSTKKISTPTKKEKESAPKKKTVTKKPEISKSKNASLDFHYMEFFQNIKAQVVNARIRAARVLNSEMIQLYWNIGKEIVTRQEEFGWGKSVVEKLSRDLKKELPNTRGFSSQNLWYMRQFFVEYQDYPILQQLVGEIPWGHNLLILSKIKSSEAREYYLRASAELGWSRNVLLNQIKAKAYERQQKVMPNNFEGCLPVHLAEQATETMKDIYMLDFLGITEPVLEREMEQRMVERIRDVILELGYGFCYIGNQYKITLKGKEYFIDLLFFHRKLKCLIAIDLKTGIFKPEYTGKMNFYLNLLDDFVKEEGENPSIGMILCAERDRVEVEYALRGIDKPMGVAQYSFTRDLPDELAGKLPPVKQLESEILKELAMEGRHREKAKNKGRNKRKKKGNKI